MSHTRTSFSPTRAFLLGALIAAGAACAESDPVGDAGARDATSATDAGQAVDSGVADAGTTTIAQCPLSARARVLVENLVDQAAIVAGNVAFHARPREAAFVIGLPATDQIFPNFAFLVDECRGPSSFVPYCQGAVEPTGFFADHDLCTQMGCEAAGVALYDIWLTMIPHTEPNDRHLFTYTSTAPGGEASMNPNPRLIWRAEVPNEDEARVRSRIDWALTISSPGTPDLVGDFDGYLAGERATVGGEAEVEVRVGLRFPRIASDGVAITASATIAPDHTVVGTLRQNGVELGTFVAPPVEYRALAIDWSTACE